MLWARILSLISPIIISLISIFLFWQETKFFYIFGTILILTILSLLWLINISQNLKRWQEKFYYICLGALLVIGLMMLFILLENTLFKIGILVLLLISLIYYYDGIFNKLYKSSLIKKYQISNHFNIVEIIIVFFISSGLFGFKDFLSIKSIWLIIAVFLLFYLLSIVDDYIKNSKLTGGVVFYAVTGLIMAEVFWAILSLSLVYYVKGIFLSFLYLLFNLFKNYNQADSLNKKSPKNYIIIIIIVLIIILSTAKWF